MSLMVQVIEANGLRFTVAVAGSGPRLLFLTGTGADLRAARTPVKSVLTERFEVLTFDQRGLGRSDKPDGPYRMCDYADDAVAILDALGWGSVALAGYSFGGMVAQEIAIRYPERVTRLALASCAAGGAGGSSYPIHELQELEPLARARAGIMITDRRITPAWIAAHPDEADQLISARLSRSTFDESEDAAAGLHHQIAARAEHDTYDRLGQITAPTLVLAGAHDGQALESVQRAMASQIANCEVRVIEGTHAMLWQNEETIEVISEFLLRGPGTT